MGKEVEKSESLHFSQRKKRIFKMVFKKPSLPASGMRLAAQLFH